MKPAHLPPDVSAVWDEVIARYDPEDAAEIEGHELEAYCGVVARLRNAQHRIHEEGMFVADKRGDPAPHPALAVERACNDALRKWGRKFAGTI
jgi:phage terminase small subunit